MNGQTGRIVVGYDGSTQATHALRWAAAEAARRGSRLTVLYVVDYGRFVGGGGNSGGVGWAAYLADDSAKLLVDRGVERARQAAPDVQVSGEAKVGRPIGALVEASGAADLMVVGTRGHGELVDVALGSVAATVAAHARCPVVIVRGGAAVMPDPAHPVVVGVDGSPASLAALVYAAETAKNASAPLVVVCAWNDVARFAGWVSVDTRVVIDRDHLLDAERGSAGEILQTAVDRVRTDYPEVDVTSELVEGAPAPALLAAGADAGLVVIGSQGHGALAGLLLGSVSHAVLPRSTRPVAVVRRRIAAPLPRVGVHAPGITVGG
jgi:nucleotide-binding universal stress UspA family protein